MAFKQLFTGGSVYRNIVYFAKARREYSRNGYEKAARYFGSTDLESDVTKCVYLEIN